MSIRKFIRTIPDFPKPGILFRDITSLLADPQGLRLAIDQIADYYRDKEIRTVVGIEARGFIFGTAVAYQMGLGFVPLRKPGKLPGRTSSISYQLEYGEDRLEIHDDALRKNERVLLIDDLVATGGTAAAAAELVRGTGATIAGCCFVVDLPDLGGMKKLRSMDIECMALCEFAGD